MSVKSITQRLGRQGGGKKKEGTSKTENWQTWPETLVLGKSVPRLKKKKTHK